MLDCWIIYFWWHHCSTCAEVTVHALPATVTKLPAKSLTFGHLQGPRLPGERWMGKEKEGGDGWMDEREHGG